MVQVLPMVLAHSRFSLWKDVMLPQTLEFPGLDTKVVAAVANMRSVALEAPL
jgi:hypothetical protein